MHPFFIVARGVSLPIFHLIADFIVSHRVKENIQLWRLLWSAYFLLSGVFKGEENKALSSTRLFLQATTDKCEKIALAVLVVLG